MIDDCKFRSVPVMYHEADLFFLVTIGRMSEVDMVSYGIDIPHADVHVQWKSKRING